MVGAGFASKCTKFAWFDVRDSGIREPPPPYTHTSLPPPPSFSYRKVSHSHRWWGTLWKYCHCDTKEWGNKQARNFIFFCFIFPQKSPNWRPVKRAQLRLNAGVVIFLFFCLTFGSWQALIAGRVSGAVFLCVFFCDGGVKAVKWQLFQLPTSADGALLRRCRLLTPFALVFYHLKLTENRGREEKGCLTADEPQRQPDEPPSGKRRQSASKSMNRSRSGGTCRTKAWLQPFSLLLNACYFVGR